MPKHIEPYLTTCKHSCMSHKWSSTIMFCSVCGSRCTPPGHMHYHGILNMCPDGLVLVWMYVGTITLAISEEDMMESWNDKLWLFAVWPAATTTPWLSMLMCFCMPCCGHTTLPLCKSQLPSGPSEHIVCCWNICIICCDMVWEMCLHMFVVYDKWMHRAELLLDLGLSMPSPPSLERARPGCMSKKVLMPGCLTNQWRLGRMKQNGGLDAWQKKGPGCMTTKTDACTKTHFTRNLPVLYCIIPYYTVLCLIMFLGTWQLQWVKGLLGPLWQHSENQKEMFAWATWQLRWAKGGGWHVHTKNVETYSHAQSRGGGGHQPYSKHS